MPPMELLSFGRKAHCIFSRWCEPVCRQYELNQTELDVLLFLANNPDRNTARDACRLYGIKKGLVSITVEALLQRGLLRRENDPDDRRLHRLTPTKAADPIICDGCAAAAKFSQAVTACLTAEEHETYISLTHKLMEQINQLDAGGKNLG